MNKIFILRDDESLARIKKGLHNCLSTLDLEKPVQVKISLYKEDKTAEQRSGFHLLCGILGDELGHTKGQMKEVVKQYVFGTDVINVTGEDVVIVKSSEDAKRGEYSKLIEGAYMIAAFNGFQLPELRHNDS